MLRHILAASALTLAVATPVFAQELHSQVVTFGDLNLKRDHDADRLIDRIENAADNVCGETNGPAPLTEVQSVRGCTYVAERNAVSDVAHPNVTSRYYGVEPQVIIEGSYDPDPYYGGK